MGSIVSLLLSASIAMLPAASNPSCHTSAQLVVNDNTMEATAPFGSALVLLYSQGDLVRLVFADAHGEFTLDNLLSGSYRLDMLNLGSLDTSLGGVDIEVRPKLGQRVHYGFYPHDGCLAWVATTN